MEFKNSLESALTSEFNPLKIKVIDESGKHAGHGAAPAGGNSHYHVRIVSNKFKDLSRIERHQTIYRVLAPYFAQGLHALAIEALTPEEHKLKNT